MAVNPRQPDGNGTSSRAAEDEAAALEARYGWLEPETVIELAVDRFFPGQIAAVSSFGADSAVLLHMIARIDRSLPVLFLDTGKHFDVTIDYRDALVSDLRLTSVVAVKPDAGTVASVDPAGDLHKTSPDACCHIRKVEPMARAVAPFGAWFTGRKRFQAATRQGLPTFEAAGERVRVNPLASWTVDDIKNYLYTNNLRRHPLVAYGYLSIGCQPCTSPVRPGQSVRSGRWAGRAKTECGIHFAADGSIMRMSGEIGAG